MSPPTVEKKRKTVSRDSLLKQAEKIMDDVAHTKALLGQLILHSLSSVVRRGHSRI